MPLEKLVNVDEASVSAAICRELIEEHRKDQERDGSL